MTRARGAVQTRWAQLGDHLAITEVFYACWTQSYRGVLPDRLVDSLGWDDASKLWQRVLTEVAPGELVLAVAGTGANEQVLGVLRLDPAESSTGEPGWGMIHSLYVSPNAQGRGVGTLLLNVARSSLEEFGCTQARLWVFRDNHPSRKFYHAHGGLPTGQERVQPEFGEPEIQLSFPLGKNS